MYNLLIAFAAGIAVTLLVRLFGFSVWAGIIPGVIAFLGTYLLLARRVASRITVLSSAAQKELSTAPANKREQQLKVDKAIKTLEEGLKYEKWQFLVASEIHAQIGMIKYMVKDLDGAEKHLSKANPRNFMAKAMQGALFFQKKDYARMKQAFEAAVKSGKKESIVWAVYAWCLLQLKEKDAAQSVIARGVEVNPSDEKLKGALTSLQNDKRLKMRPWEPMWWQFGLEAPPMPVMGGGGGGRRVQYVRR
jgi:tetratricopeptide (TPR) repeat protein